MRMLFENVNYSINNIKILSNINISISSGKFTSIVGRNGSGKTTLLGILTSNIQPTDGKIMVPSVKKFSYIPQKIQDPPFLKVFEIVMAGMTLLDIDDKYKYKLINGNEHSEDMLMMKKLLLSLQH